VSSIAFSPDGRFLVSGSHDTTVKVWDLSRDGAEATISRNPGRVTSIALSPNGSTLAVATDENETVELNEDGQISSIERTEKNGAQAKLLSFPSGELKTTLSARAFSVTCVAFTADGTFIATCGDRNGVKLWDTETGKEARTLEGSGLVAFSPDGKLIGVVERYGHDAMILELASAKELYVLKGHAAEITCLTFSPESKLIATGGRDKTVRLWDVSTGLLKATFTCNQAFVEAVQFSPDGKILAVGSREKSEMFELWHPNGQLIFWDISTATELASHSAHSRGIMCIAFSPQGDRLATGGCDGTIKLWRVPRCD